MPRKKLEAIVRDCYECGHWSVFEFAEWDFQASEVSRVLETQAVRSRLASFEWETGRRENAYLPCDAIDDKNYMSHLIEEITDITSDLAPEDARYYIPQGVARKGRIKRNHRNLMETSMVRLCTHAQQEYRDFMLRCKALVTEVDPFLGELLQPKCVVNLYCNEKQSCRLNGVRTKDEVRKLLMG